MSLLLLLLRGFLQIACCCCCCYSDAPFVSLPQSIIPLHTRTCPTDPLTGFEPRHQNIGEFRLARKRRTTVLEASKLWKGRSGST